MTFLHFSLLSLAGLAAIPILLHFLTLYRLRTVELSTFRFLFDSYVQQRRRIRFLEAILAILRALFVLAIVLVVSRPVMSSWLALFGGVTGEDCIMLVDCSASMNARTEGRSTIDRARAAAAAVAERLADNRRLTLVRITAQAEVIFSRFASDRQAIRDGIDSLTTSPSRANLFASIQQLFEADEYRRPKQTIYLFTDCQASSWREVQEQGLASILPRDCKLTVVNVGSKAPMANRAIAGDPPEDSRVIAGLPVVLRARIANHSPSDSAPLTIGVTIDEQEIGQATIELKPGESGMREIVYTPRSAGVQRGRFEITSDAFPDDDTFLFTLQVVPAVKVVVVNGSPSADPLQSESLYVRTALEADPSRDFGQKPGTLSELAPARDFVRSLDVQEVTEGGVNPALLEAASVVILADAGALNPQHFTWLREFVARGGGLLVFPGDKVNPEAYTKQFFNLPTVQNRTDRRPGAAVKGSASPSDPLVDATIGPPTGDLERLDGVEKFANISFAHPIFSVFDDPDGRYLATAQFYRRFQIDLSPDAAATWPVASFRSGQPAILESRLGRGTVLLTAFPANAKWSNLPLKPEFVPLLLRMISYVMKPAETTGPSVVPAGAAAEIAVVPAWAPVTAKVTRPDKHTAPIQFDRSDGQLAAAFADTEEKGYYSIEISGGPIDQPKRAELAFAVNLSPDESNFAMITPENLSDWLPGFDATLVDASAETEQTAGQVGEEREIWRPLIAMMFVIIAIEFLLSTLSGSRDRELPTVAQRIRQLSPSHWVAQMTGAERTGQE